MQTPDKNFDTVDIYNTGLVHFNMVFLSDRAELHKMTSSTNLRYGSVWTDKFFEMENQEF